MKKLIDQRIPSVARLLRRLFAAEFIAGHGTSTKLAKKLLKDDPASFGSLVQLADELEFGPGHTAGRFVEEPVASDGLDM